MNYKLLAVDIDGTVVKEHTNTPTKRVIDAIRKANEKINISLLSARAWKDQQIIMDLLNLKGFYHVLENGTKVINPLGELEYNKHIPAREVQQIIDTTVDLFDDIGFCIDSRWINKYKIQKKKLLQRSLLFLFLAKKQRKYQKR